MKLAIILVSDNFSKAILGWSVSLKKDGENAKAALQRAIKTIQKHHPDLDTASLLTDGGKENHNMLVEDFISNIETPEIIKLLAQKDVKFSNSSIESINKIIKRYLRKKKPDTLEKLIECLENEIISDYNIVRPHSTTSSPQAVLYLDSLLWSVILLKMLILILNNRSYRQKRTEFNKISLLTVELITVKASKMKLPFEETRKEVQLFSTKPKLLLQYYFSKNF